MRADTLSLISLICFIAAGSCLILAIFLWVKFRILQIINDLSGRSAKKSIIQMRAANEKNGAKAYRPSQINVKRGKITDTIPKTENNTPNYNKVHEFESNNKGQLLTGVLGANHVTPAEQRKAATDGAASTTKLVLEAEEIWTDEEATMLLDQEARQAPKRSGGKKLTMINEVILTHTNEVIE